jgi:hypothetical protein
VKIRIKKTTLTTLLPKEITEVINQIVEITNQITTNHQVTAEEV